ncbi:ATP phosphoribosyltransferase regulatory subunit [Natranaerobius thermophilus]|uniref:ATP phosphoribosyltransferase regulatory subunit n=1 Tax=Natranaerobius thermophilus (strain ATCC BAA-1301 / DSM 18059 / JW/NM-WN-LF) TaxID=457570 RepID=B2A6X8_NATTJ|nr:ATP phosphoribosyltransferase regulatory subunit [Natranaerobius thermophilus]ACB85569.1 Histidine--tRNA ligase [Natranaerobius thermophilus JW/NM-WN-LF]
MVPREIQLLQKPSGVNDNLPNRVEKFRLLENKILETFKLWGYDEVSVPYIEYSNIFSVNKENLLEQQMFQFNDETGRLVVLRPDFTPSIARLVATYYKNHPLPLRLCYSGKIFRANNGNSINEKEQTQVGVELIGGEAPGGDAELVAMAAETFQKMEIKNFVICIGNLKFINNLLDCLKVDQSSQSMLIEALNENNLVQYQGIIDSLELESDSKDILKKLPKFRGNKENLNYVREVAGFKPVMNILDELENIFKTLESYGLQDKVTFDLSLVRKLDYYTGFIMEGYAEKVGFPLCGGGRYDKLMDKYGMSLPATGFAFSFDSLIDLVKVKGDALSKLHFGYTQGKRDQALEHVKDYRQRGYRVSLELNSQELEVSRRKAKEQGADQFYYIGNHGMVKENISTNSERKDV